MIDRQDELLAGELQDMPGHVELVGLDLALADRVALGLEKRVGHGAADQELVDLLEQALDDQDLVGDLGSAHDGDIGALGVAQERVEDLQFLLDQEADGAAVGGELLGHRHHRRLVAVAGAEGVVDVAVGQGGHLLGEGGIALLFALVEPDVLENHDSAGGKLGAGGLRLRPDGVVGLLDRNGRSTLRVGRPPCPGGTGRRRPGRRWAGPGG